MLMLFKIVYNYDVIIVMSIKFYSSIFIYNNEKKYCSFDSTKKNSKDFNE